MNCPSCRAENEATAATCVKCGAGLTAPTQVVVTVDLSPGSLFHNRYEIIGLLGRGGMGMVYKARDRTLDEVVAIKVLRPDFAEDPKMAERFKSEIKLARKVHNKNVCAIHDYGENRGLLYISMEYIEGVDLKRILRDKGGLPPDRAYDIAIEVAEGLQAVHEAGIIHRDLKSPNIMIDTQGHARLMDFGIAKREGAEGTMTATGHIIGTPEYMSPEQAQGVKVDFRSDVYALGVVTWEAFTGHVPFRGETPLSTILKHLHDPPPLDGPTAPPLPADLKPVLRKALAKDPATRYASAHDFAEALRFARSPSRRQQPMSTSALQAPTMARQVPATVVQLPAVRTSRSWIGWLAAAAVVVVGVGTLLALRPWSADTPTQTAMATMPPATLPASPTAVAASVPPVTTAPATAAPDTVPTARSTPLPQPTRVAASPKATAAATPGPSPRIPATVTPRTSATPNPPVATPAPVAAPPPADVAGMGQLLITARPWATVFVDGKKVGEVPLDKIELPAGSHRVLLRHPAYEVYEQTVVIRPGQTERVDFDFSKNGIKKP